MCYSDYNQIIDISKHFFGTTHATCLLASQHFVKNILKVIRGTILAFEMDMYKVHQNLSEDQAWISLAKCVFKR
jgi:hypothetical protein